MWISSVTVFTKYNTINFDEGNDFFEPVLKFVPDLILRKFSINLELSPDSKPEPLRNIPLPIPITSEQPSLDIWLPQLFPGPSQLTEPIRVIELLDIGIEHFPELLNLRGLI